MLVTGDIDTVFGPLDTKDGVEELPESFRPTAAVTRPMCR
jgi:hypothetical protein